MSLTALLWLVGGGVIVALLIFLYALLSLAGSYEDPE
jgi:hypothetical protein